MSPRALSVPVRVRGKVIGRYLGATLTKPVFRGKHFVWKHKAWGFDVCLIDALRAKGCRRVVLKVKDDKDLISIDFDDLVENGFRDDLGYGEQIFVRECYFEKSSDARQRNLAL